MKILKRLKSKWLAMTTAEKIGVGIDIVCGIGGGIITRTVGDKLTENCVTKTGRFCVRAAVMGAVLAGVESGSGYLKKNYGDPAGMIIDVATGKAKLKSVDIGKEGIVLEGEYKDE